MGQKTNPIGLRLGINRNWDSVWFDEKNYADRLHEDIILRNYINNTLNQIRSKTSSSDEASAVVSAYLGT